MAKGITIKRTKTDLADKVLAFVDNQIVDFENGDEKLKYYDPGQHQLVAHMYRINGSTGVATGTVTVTQGGTVIKLLPLRLSAKGETTISFGDFTVAP